jgi:RHS repeat-associated protein
LTTNYTYLDVTGTNNTTTLLETLKNGTSDAFIYTYDANGNILTIKEGSVLKATYTYDQLNQLSREDNNYTGKSIDYSYDIGGNLLSRSEYSYVGGIRGALIDTYNYQYSTSWKDKLVNYDGSAITYDNIGNPTEYRNSWDMTWDNGRELSTIKLGSNSIGAYKYNADGIRTSKTVGTDTTTFLLNGSSIVRSTKGNLVMDFFYDEKGNLYGFKHGSAMYYYLRNGQNDIIGIIDSSGTQVVGYTYNSWGVVESVSGSLASTIGNDNPFRYRGYYLDNETGFYYLNSRYYDPQVGRFINADSVGLLASVMQNPNIDKNLYSYCDNNPVTRSDSSGKFWETIFDIVTIGFSIYDVCKNPSDPWAWAGLAGDVIDLIPIVTGVGEGIKAISKTNKIVDSIQAADNVADAVDAAGDAGKAINNGIDTYGNLQKATKGSGLEVHHIVEKRLRDPLGISDTDSMLSVALSKADHRKFTKAWRGEIPYGTNYRGLKPDEIWGVAQKIYKDFPELLEASKKTIFR